jgi:hypothetical protein
MHKVQKEIVENLIYASVGYGSAGLSLYHNKDKPFSSIQAAIGNLAIATELLLKGYLANKHLLLILREVPLELKAALCAPEALPSSFRKAPFEIELRSGSFRAIGFKDVIILFGVFQPELKKRLSSHLNFLYSNRNVCVHSTLPDFRQYELERSVFLYLTLFDHIKKQGDDFFKNFSIGNIKENEEFLKKFNEDRLNRVHTAMDNAKEKAKKIEKKTSIKVDDWDLFVIECPVCGSDAVLEGETEEESDYGSGEDFPSVYLTFFGYSFNCNECGLKLEDYDELKIAGIDPDIDRTEEVDKWMEDHWGDYEPTEY